jgi:hypothetical protein
MITRKHLNHIFYVYNEATIAVIMACAAVLELMAGIFVGGPFSPLFFGASVLFTFVSIGCVRYIVRSEAKYSYKWGGK